MGQYRPDGFPEYEGFTYPKTAPGTARGLIAHAIIDEDEDGTMTTGNRGDQMGYELNATKWYSYPWIAVYRPTLPDAKRIKEDVDVYEIDQEKAEIMADFMERAVSNGFIGYDQNRNVRWVFFNECLKHDFDPRMIDRHVSGDCSALVFTAVYAAYRIPRDTEDWHDPEKPGENPLWGIPKAGLDDYLERQLGFKRYDVKDFPKLVNCDPETLVKDDDNADKDETHFKLLRGDLLRSRDHWAMYI